MVVITLNLDTRDLWIAYPDGTRSTTIVSPYALRSVFNSLERMITHNGYKLKSRSLYHLSIGR